MVVCVVFVLGGCSAGVEGGPAGTTSAPGAVEVEEDLVTVDLRIQRSLLDPGGTLTDDEVVSAAREEGIDAVVDGDAVIYTMTKPQRDHMLAEMRAAAQNAVDGQDMRKKLER